ncbi:glycosyltransferase [Streptosporangium sp. 'caverna']|uniref:glycosyltransferase n=1 Tax=Streptosporangium sp. 'caverna' TaxID=2202249 RepID=UPI0013A6E407|nr:glycosyltransferase [Streptosporangium sp. 'caverna']
MRDLRVCEVVKTLDAGGAEVLLVERLRRAPRANKDYTVVCLQASTDELIERLRASGITVVNLGPSPRPLVYADLVRTVRRLAPDVLNVHSPTPAAVLWPFVRLARRRPLLVSTVHYCRRPTTVRFNRLTTGISMLADRLTRRFDDRTVAVSSQVAHSPSVRGARRLLTRVHGVDVTEQRLWATRSAIVRCEFGVPEGAFLVACVANFRPEKNHSLLIQAAAEVLRARADAVFLLAGDGPLKEHVAGEIERRGLGGRVRILGRVRQAGRLAAAADLVVLSSHYEGLPVVVMEALAAGVPVVSTEVGGIPELVRSGWNGILTEPGSPDALAAGILEAMEPDVHRLLCSGAAASSEGVEMADTAEWFEHLYEEMTSAARRD